MLETPTQLPIPVTLDATGVLRVASTRVTLDSVMTAWKQGASAEEIALRYPTVHVRDIYAVLAWALQHLDDVEDYLQKRTEQAEQAEQDASDRFGLTGLRQRLLDRRH